MFDIDLLISKNPPKRSRNFKIVGGKYVYTLNKSQFNLSEIKKFISFVQLCPVNIPIFINLSGVSIRDKLCYVLLECIFEYMIVKCGKKVTFQYVVEPEIGIEGISSSPLNILRKQFNGDVKSEYIQKFNRDIFKNHYRKMITVEENADGIAVSKMMQEIEVFLKAFSVQKEYISDVTEVLSELVDNGLEHSNSDCLIDIDVTDEYVKRGDDTNSYYGINITILSISDVLIGDKVQLFFQCIEKNKWYEKLHLAHNTHSQFWDEKYRENDFFMMSAFQHRISGRDMNYTTGGTGLTTLISALESKSDAYNCYVVSGDRILCFHHDLLKLDSEGWVGFNQDNDFLNKPPDGECILSSPIYFPGVAYNLNFVMRKENENE